MAQMLLIMGESGTGKSTSMRNCDPATTAVVNPVGKPLPFKGKFTMLNSEVESRKICKFMKEQAAAGKKLLVVDDFQYILSVPYMNRIKENGWDKWNDFGANYFEIIEVCKELPDDVVVAYMTHTETLENGVTTIKLIGKLLREKITIEGLFTIVLRTGVNEGKYYFYTQNSGKDTVIFYDFEYDTVKQAKEKGVNLGKNECVAFTKAFCEYVTSHGYKAGIYSNIDYHKNMYTDELISQYIYWLADYTGDPDYPCMFHQYTSKGSVDGIAGNVDLDYFYGDTAQPDSPKKSVDEVAQDVVNGKYGNGADRKAALEAAGYNYDEIQAKVNEILGVDTTPKKSVDEIAQEVINGAWGNGQDRKNRIEQAGYDYTAVQNKVNELCGTPKKSIDEIARAVIRGEYGNGADRKNRITAEGYDYAAVQARVNDLM